MPGQPAQRLVPGPGQLGRVTGPGGLGRVADDRPGGEPARAGRASATASARRPAPRRPPRARSRGSRRGARRRARPGRARCRSANVVTSRTPRATRYGSRAARRRRPGRPPSSSSSSSSSATSATVGPSPAGSGTPRPAVGSRPRDRIPRGVPAQPLRLGQPAQHVRSGAAGATRRGGSPGTRGARRARPRRSARSGRRAICSWRACAQSASKMPSKPARRTSLRRAPRRQRPQPDLVQLARGEPQQLAPVEQPQLAGRVRDLVADRPLQHLAHPQRTLDRGDRRRIGPGRGHALEQGAERVQRRRRPRRATGSTEAM